MLAALKTSEKFIAEVERRLADIGNSISKTEEQETSRRKEIPRLEELGLYWQDESLPQRVRLYKREDSWRPFGLESNRPLLIFLSYRAPSVPWVGGTEHESELFQTLRYYHHEFPHFFGSPGLESKFQFLNWSLPGLSAGAKPSVTEIELEAAQFAERTLKKSFDAEYFTELVSKHLLSNPHIAGLLINLAVQLRMQGDAERALAAFREGLLRAMPRDPSR
jgi:hypothetical protein